MAWFYEDPERLSAAAPASIRNSPNATSEGSDQLIPVAALNQHYLEAAAATIGRAEAAQRTWSRFIDNILLAFRTPRGPFEQSQSGDVTDKEEELTPGASERAAYDPAVDKSLAHFEKLFALLTKEGSPSRNVIIAFELTQYVCDRLRPDAKKAKAWLERLIRALLDAGLPSERRSDAAAAILTLLAVAPAPEAGAFRWARGCILRLGFDFFGEAPSEDGVRGFMSVLSTRIAFSELWLRLRTVRTYHEQVRAYLRALQDRQSSDDYPDLRQDAPKEWTILEEAITSEIARRRLAVILSSQEACPLCHIKLPAPEASKLRAMGVATAKGCCNRVVIWRGPEIR